MTKLERFPSHIYHRKASKTVGAYNSYSWSLCCLDMVRVSSEPGALHWEQARCQADS